MDELLNRFEPITLDEMSGVRLMNRTDTKFVTSVERLRLLLEMAVDDYRIQEVDGNRQPHYGTVYFDTDNMDMYLAHHNGRLNRQKVRVRSYLDSSLAFLEVKTKDNHRRTKKKRVSLDPATNLTMQAWPFAGDAQVEAFLRQHDRLHGVGENRFRRITLVNKAMTERLTIDSGLSFHSLQNGMDVRLPRLVVIELKRDGLQNSPVLALLNRLRIHPMGFSKYCMGTALTHPQLKNNRFKERLHAVERISHPA